jgi:hypothetical protein
MVLKRLKQRSRQFLAALASELAEDVLYLGVINLLHVVQHAPQPGIGALGTGRASCRSGLASAVFGKELGLHIKRAHGVVEGAGACPDVRCQALHRIFVGQQLCDQAIQ